MTLTEKLTTLETVLREEAPDLPLIKGEPMARYTTLHLGGPADLLVCPEKPEQLQRLLRLTHEMDIPTVVMGNGSNLLVRDGGIRGLVIRLCRSMQHIQVDGEGIRAEAGVMMGALSMAAAEANLGGLAFASGIPGTVGGGVYMNAGAYGGEMSQVVSLVEGFDRTGEAFRYTGEEMAFRHRYSRLMDEDKIITRVTFRLHHARREDVLADMVDFNTRRAEKQPLTQYSAGSTFKRPANGFAAAMIDECGLKGYAVGGAQVSEKHAGFCVNKGGTAADFLALMAHVQGAVQQKFGVLLEPEVQVLGEDAPAVQA